VCGLRVATLPACGHQKAWSVRDSIRLSSRARCLSITTHDQLPTRQVCIGTSALRQVNLHELAALDRAGLNHDGVCAAIASQYGPGMLTQGSGGPPGPLGRRTISQDSDALPVESAWDLTEVTYRWPPWLTGSYHPRYGRALGRELVCEVIDPTDLAGKEVLAFVPPDHREQSVFLDDYAVARS
jgi:hypothetical protein